MPQYKKKKVPAFGRRPKGKTDKAPMREKTERIAMHPSREKTSERENNGVRVIKGKKLQKRQRTRILAAVAVFIAAICTVFHFILPIGIMENVGNAFATLGAGGYPIELYGTEALNAQSKGSYYYVLTDNSLSAFSAGGKKLYSEAHGFAKPVLKASDTRALVFDQGGSELSIRNLTKITNTKSTEQPILTACITRNGGYALATESADYTAAVSVYNRKDKLLYEWYSADDMINNVALSPNGKQLVVSTINAAGGSLMSKVSVFEYDSANAVFSVRYDGEAVYSIESNNKGFYVLTAGGCDFYSWSKFKKNSYKSEYELASSRSASSGQLLVFNRSSDRTDNRIVYISKAGETELEVSYHGAIGDIALYNNHIYLISDTSVIMLDKSGKKIASGSCDFGAVRLVVTSKQKAAIITNSDISQVNLK